MHLLVCCLPPYETSYQEDGVRSLPFTPASPVPRTVPGTSSAQEVLAEWTKWTFNLEILFPFYHHTSPDVGRCEDE